MSKSVSVLFADESLEASMNNARRAECFINLSVKTSPVSALTRNGGLTQKYDAIVIQPDGLRDNGASLPALIEEIKNTRPEAHIILMSQWPKTNFNLASGIEYTYVKDRSGLDNEALYTELEKLGAQRHPDFTKA